MNYQAMLGPTIQFYQCLDQNCIVHTMLIKNSSVEQQTLAVHIYSYQTEYLFLIYSCIAEEISLCNVLFIIAMNI